MFFSDFREGGARQITQTLGNTSKTISPHFPVFWFCYRNAVCATRGDTQFSGAPPTATRHAGGGGFQRPWGWRRAASFGQLATGRGVWFVNFIFYVSALSTWFLLLFSYFLNLLMVYIESEQ